MISQAIDYIGRENLESIAVMNHVPIKGVYVFVYPDGSFGVYNDTRFYFNPNLRKKDFYSYLVSMNKPIASKLISSNNYFTFWVRNTGKLKEEDIDRYYAALGLPEEYAWFKDWVKAHVWELGNTYKDIIKIFFPGKVGAYRTLGMKYWLEKSITYTKFSKDLGLPVGVIANENKKPYLLTSKINAYLLTKEECLDIKLFYDILKGFLRKGFNYIYMDEEGIYPANKELPPSKPVIIGGIFFAFAFDDKGQIFIQDMEPVPRYSVALE